MIARLLDRAHSPERCLWLAVLAEQLLLITRERDPTAASRPGPEAGPRAVEDAVYWVGSADFRMVCWLAGIDPAAVLDWLDREMSKDLSNRWMERQKIRSIPSIMRYSRQVVPSEVAA